jgi:hypothetical protein
MQVSTGKCPVRLGLRELMDRFLIQTNRAQFGQELREFQHLFAKIGENSWTIDFCKNGSPTFARGLIKEVSKSVILRRLFCFWFLLFLSLFLNSKSYEKTCDKAYVFSHNSLGI